MYIQFRTVEQRNHPQMAQSTSALHANYSCRNGYLPSLSVCNGLDLDNIPQPLKDLNSLQTTFIARRIPFMKLLALPCGKQRAVHGCVVKIPVEPTESLSVLPRVPSSDTFIPVKLKRALKYRGHVYSQNIKKS